MVRTLARRISEDEIDTIRSSVDIVDVIGQDIELTKRGANYLGLCPFHNEKTPSFTVNSERQFFHCFGCGKSGNVFNYLMQTDNIEFLSAVKKVAEIGNVEFDFEPSSQNVERPHQRLYDLHHDAADFLHHFLVNTEFGVKPLEYLKAREIDSEIIEHFNIGFNPTGSQQLLKKLLIGKGYTEGELVESGIFRQNDVGKLQEVFYNRITFPLKNEYGQVIAFSGRTMDPNHSAKYLNSPQTSIFNKSVELYHLSDAKPVIRKTSEVYIMEGFMDVIAAYKVGIMNTVATMGTSLTEQHINRLIRLAQKAIFAFDGDNAGVNATYKALRIAENRIYAEVVSFPEKLDPDEYLRKYGTEAMQNLMQHGRTSKISYLIDYIKNQYNLANEAEQLAFVQKLLPLLKSVKSIVEQDVYLNQVVKLAPLISKDILIRELNDNGNNTINQSQEYYPEESYDPNSDSNQYFEPTYHEKPTQFFQGKKQALARLSQLERAERQLLARAINSTSILQELINNDKFNFHHKIYQEIYVKIIAYFLSHDIIEVTDILESLDNELRFALNEISHLNIDDEVTEKEIQDLVTLIAKQPLNIKLQELMVQQEQAKANGNFEAELTIGLEIVQLRRELENKEG